MRRIPATELSAYLLMQKQQLSNLCVENVFAQVAPDKDQIKEYLENPPAGTCSSSLKPLNIYRQYYTLGLSK